MRLSPWFLTKTELFMKVGLPNIKRQGCKHEVEVANMTWFILMFTSNLGNIVVANKKVWAFVSLNYVWIWKPVISQNYTPLN